MCFLSCKTKFRIFELCEDYHCDDRPYILVTICGKHPHPILLPQKTLPALRSKYFNYSKGLTKTSRTLLRVNFFDTQLQSHTFANVFLIPAYSNTDRPSCLSGKSSTSGFIYYPSVGYSFPCCNRVARSASLRLQFCHFSDIMTRLILQGLFTSRKNHYRPI